MNPDVQRSAAVTKLFLKHGELQVTEVLGAIAADDRERLQRAAHKLKGSAVVIGAEVLAALCALLESCPDERAKLAPELEHAFARVQHLLSRGVD